MCINVDYIFVIGDFVGQLMFVYKVVYEGYVVVEVIVGQKYYFDLCVIFLVVYIELEVVWVGLIEKEVKEQGVSYEIVIFFWVVLGCVIVFDVINGMIKMIFEKEIGCVIGGVMVGINVGEMFGEIGLVIEMGVDVEDVVLIIYVYLIFNEFIGLVFEIFEGSIIDLLNLKVKKKK